MDAATGISPEYADLVSLSLRQVLGSIDITVSSNSQSDPDPTDVMVFMKDIGASGYVLYKCRRRLADIHTVVE